MDSRLSFLKIVQIPFPKLETEGRNEASNLTDISVAGTITENWSFSTFFRVFYNLFLKTIHFSNEKNILEGQYLQYQSRFQQFRQHIPAI